MIETAFDTPFIDKWARTFTPSFGHPPMAIRCECIRWGASKHVLSLFVAYEDPTTVCVSIPAIIFAPHFNSSLNTDQKSVKADKIMASMHIFVCAFKINMSNSWGCLLALLLTQPLGSRWIPMLPQGMLLRIRIVSEVTVFVRSSLNPANTQLGVVLHRDAFTSTKTTRTHVRSRRLNPQG